MVNEDSRVPEGAENHEPPTDGDNGRIYKLWTEGTNEERRLARKKARGFHFVPSSTRQTFLLHGRPPGYLNIYVPRPHAAEPRDKYPGQQPTFNLQEERTEGVLLASYYVPTTESVAGQSTAAQRDTTPEQTALPTGPQRRRLSDATDPPTSRPRMSALNNDGPELTPTSAGLPNAARTQAVHAQENTTGNDIQRHNLVSTTAVEAGRRGASLPLLTLPTAALPTLGEVESARGQGRPKNAGSGDEGATAGGDLEPPILEDKKDIDTVDVSHKESQGTDTEDVVQDTTAPQLQNNGRAHQDGEGGTQAEASGAGAASSTRHRTRRNVTTTATASDRLTGAWLDSDELLHKLEAAVRDGRPRELVFSDRLIELLRNADKEEQQRAQVRANDRKILALLQSWRNRNAAGTPSVGAETLRLQREQLVKLLEENEVAVAELLSRERTLMENFAALEQRSSEQHQEQGDGSS